LHVTIEIARDFRLGPDAEAAARVVGRNSGVFRRRARYDRSINVRRRACGLDRVPAIAKKISSRFRLGPNPEAAAIVVGGDGGVLRGRARYNRSVTIGGRARGLDRVPAITVKVSSGLRPRPQPETAASVVGGDSGVLCGRARYDRGVNVCGRACGLDRAPAIAVKVSGGLRLGPQPEAAAIVV